MNFQDHTLNGTRIVHTSNVHVILKLFIIETHTYTHNIFPLSFLKQA